VILISLSLMCRHPELKRQRDEGLECGVVRSDGEAVAIKTRTIEPWKAGDRAVDDPVHRARSAEKKLTQSHSSHVRYRLRKYHDAGSLRE